MRSCAPLWRCPSRSTNSRRTPVGASLGGEHLRAGGGGHAVGRGCRGLGVVGPGALAGGGQAPTGGSQAPGGGGALAPPQEGRGATGS
jgi:hypothetical protein